MPHHNYILAYFSDDGHSIPFTVETKKNLHTHKTCVLEIWSPCLRRVYIYVYIYTFFVYGHHQFSI